MAFKGGALRLIMIACYLVAFCCATVITGGFAWFTVRAFGARSVASLAIGAITMVYTATCALVTCCTAGISFFAAISIFLDIVFAALMIAVAAMNNSATNGCDYAPFPRVVYRGSGRSGCQLFVATFAVAIIAIFMFIITCITQFIIRRRGNRNTVSKV